MKLSIIVLSFNTKTLTVKCIKSLANQYKKFLDADEIEIILTDNASADGTVDEIERLKISNLKIVQNQENYGFSKGNNEGAKNANGKYILFLNTDTEVRDSGFLGMTKFLSENPKVGILGGKLLNPDGSTQPSSGKFYTMSNLILMLLGLERFGLLRESPRNVKRVDWISGACFMIRKDLFKRLSGFDENFFMYIEDMELCFRAKNKGLATYFYPDVKVFHKELGSSNREFAVNQIYRGLLYFYRKHKSLWQFFVVKFLLISKAAVAVIIGLITNNMYLRNTYGKALRFTLPAGRQGV